MPILSRILLICLIFTCACVESNKEETNSKKTQIQLDQNVPIKNKNSLSEVLKAKKDKFNEKASEYKKKIYAAGIQSVIDNQIVEQALNKGDEVIDFTLKNASDQDINLNSVLEQGPVILMWYRGGWCPYCNLTLSSMQEMLPEFKKHGANLIAITPETPDNSLTTKEKNELDFHLLSDQNNQIAKSYKIVFSLTEEVHKAYEDGFGLSHYNDDDSGELPLAATYIIGQDKIIKYAFLDADYRNRAEPSEVLEELKKLTQ